MKGKICPAILFGNFCDFVAEHLSLLSPGKQAGHWNILLMNQQQYTNTFILVAYDRPMILATAITNNAFQQLTEPLRCKCYSQIIFISLLL